ncbi:MAG TPA: aminoglycoside 3'-phosphotransferase, partial [Egibacteraceae bacterium]|nr:aminoglycoside 3'-phosphotransferase [Egibacteraceae bacterium]
MQPAPRIDDLPAAARRHLSAGESQLIYHPYSTATWRVERVSGAVLYLKAAPAELYPSLASERDRCAWLAERGAPVPEVVDYGAADGVEWLLTAALPGAPATAAPHLGAPQRTAGILGEGLRAFHEIDPAECPFDHTIAPSLRHVSARVAAGRVNADAFDAPHQHMDAEQALRRLLDAAPAEEDVVVTHGDYCFPNALIDQGRVVGYLDLG